MEVKVNFVSVVVFLKLLKLSYIKLRGRKLRGRRDLFHFNRFRVHLKILNMEVNHEIFKSFFALFFSTRIFSFHLSNHYGRNIFSTRALPLLIFLAPLFLLFWCVGLIQIKRRK